MASFSFIFGLFEQTVQFYSKSLWKNVISIQYTAPAGIQTHNLSNMSHLP